MNIRLSIRPLVADNPAGPWAHFCGPVSYWSDTVRPTERGARIAALHKVGQEAQARLDAVDNALRKLGAFDENDPHGYLA